MTTPNKKQSQQEQNEARREAQERNEQKGDRFNAEIEGNSMTVTINPTSDTRYPEGSTYVSVMVDETGKKNDATMIVSEDGEILSDNKKSSWYEPDEEKS